MDFAQVVGLGIQLLGGGFGIAIHEKFPRNGWVFQVLFMGIFHVCGDSPRVWLGWKFTLRKLWKRSTLVM